MPFQYATWDPAAKHTDVVLSNGNHTATQTAWNTRRGAHGDIGLSAGKVYFEVSLNDASRLILVGVANASWDYNNDGVGEDSAGNSWGYLAKESKKKYQNTSTIIGSGFTGAATVMVAVDLTTGAVWFGVNGTWEEGNPAAGTGASYTGLSGTLYPAVALDAILGTPEGTINAGDSAFAYTPPTGFSGWGQNVLAEVRRQWTASWDILTEARRQWSLQWGIAPPVKRQWRLTWDILIETRRQWSSSWQILTEVRRQWSATWDLLPPVKRQWVLKWAGNRVARQWRIPITWQVARQWNLAWSLRTEIRRQWSLPWGTTTEVRRQWRQSWAMTPLNRVARQWRLYHDLRAAVTVHSSPQTSATWFGGMLNIGEIALAIEEQAWGWTASVRLLNAPPPELVADTPLTVTLNGQTWNLLLDEIQIIRDNPARPEILLKAVSPAASHTSPRAARITRDWAAAAGARAICEDLLGQTIDWRIPDWIIPGGRLTVADAVPLEIARRIVGAAGGLLESLPDGTLRARYRYPLRVPDWLTTGVAHTYTDTSDNLAVTIRPRRREIYDQVTLRDQVQDLQTLSLEIDPRPDGLNAGRTQFAPGDTAGLLAHHRRGIRISNVSASNGITAVAAPQTYQATEDIIFTGNETARLSRPGRSIDSVTWLGTDLGPLSLGDDQTTLSAATPGTAIATVTYTVEADALTIQGPPDTGNRQDYPVNVHIEADTQAAAGVHIIARRGEGTHPAPDIIDPLMTEVPVALARGRNHLDHHAGLQPVLLTATWRTGIEPGQLIEVHDPLQGPAWRGQIVAIEHIARGPRLLTRLGVLRA